MFIHLALAALLFILLFRNHIDRISPNQHLQIAVVDTTASMSATDVAPSRFEDVRDRVRVMIAGMPPGKQMALITDGRTPRVVCPPASNRQTLMSRLLQIQSTSQAGTLRDAVELGRRLSNSRAGRFFRNANIVAMTDGAGFGEPPLNDHADVSVVASHTKAVENLGITRFRVRRLESIPSLCEAWWEVSNTGSQACTGRLDLTLDQRFIDSVPFEIRSQSAVVGSVPFEIRTGGKLEARIAEIDPLKGSARSCLDALTVDDAVSLELTAADRMPVTLVTSGNIALETILKSLPDIRLQVRHETPKQMSDHGLLVLDQWVPAEIPPGNVFVVHPKSDCNLWKHEGTGELSSVITIDETHEMMRSVRLNHLAGQRMEQVEPLVPFWSLASCADNRPLYFCIPRTAGPVVVLATSAEQNNLAAQTDFPILIRNMVTWYSGQHRESQRTRTADIDADVRREQPATSNLMSITESRLWSPESNSRAGTAASVMGSAVSVSTLLTIAAVLLLVLEWIIFHQKMIL